MRKITEMEGLGVVWAVQHFRPYIYGHPCDLYTDHEALKSLLNTPQPSGKLTQWGMAIQELNVEIHHSAGKHNSYADALSRLPLPNTLDAEGEKVVPAVGCDTYETELGSKGMVLMSLKDYLNQRKGCGQEMWI